MSAHAVQEELRSLAVTVLAVDATALQAETRLIDLVPDSIKLLRLVARIERRYGIELDEDVLFRVETFGELAALVAARAAEQPG